MKTLVKTIFVASLFIFFAPIGTQAQATQNYDECLQVIENFKQSVAYYKSEAARSRWQHAVDRLQEKCDAILSPVVVEDSVIEEVNITDEQPVGSAEIKQLVNTTEENEISYFNPYYEEIKILEKRLKVVDRVITSLGLLFATLILFLGCVLGFLLLKTVYEEI